MGQRVEAIIDHPQGVSQILLAAFAPGQIGEIGGDPRRVSRPVILIKGDGLDREGKAAVGHDRYPTCMCRAGGPKGERARNSPCDSKPRALRQARSTGGTPVRGKLSRRRQVSWLTGHHAGPGLPAAIADRSDLASVTRHGAAARRLQLRGQRRTPLLQAPPASRLSPVARHHHERKQGTSTPSSLRLSRRSSRRI